MNLTVSLSLHRRIVAAAFLGLIGWVAVIPVYADYPVGTGPKITVAPPPFPPEWKLGRTAPTLHITDLSGQKVLLSRFSGKPVVLEFGSLTEPAFRLSAASMNWLARKWNNKAQFLIVYQNESHPAGTGRALAINKTAGASIPQAQNQAQRIADARLAQRKLRLQFPLVTVDNQRNQTALAYGSLPNMTFLINAHGQLIAAWPWMTPWQLNGAIQAVLAGKPIPSGDMSSGFMPNTSPPMEFDYQALPPAAPQALADAIDRAGVTRQQLAKILPALTDFSTALLKIRQQIAQLREHRRQFNGNFRQSVRSAFDGLRNAVNELTRSLHRNLNHRQYQAIVSELDRGKLRRVFASANSLPGHH
ncbi:MAG: hypothetical protein M0Z50_05495 [Planctomycetia bacterium]|nr:hypothetical protein [Planctomycetia bacterium]